MTDPIHVVVHGRVQGVGFRWFVREHARRLGLTGWVKNNADGTVEVVAQGEETAVASFQEILARGPDGAQVVRLEHVMGGASEGDLRPDTFSILR